MIAAKKKKKLSAGKSKDDLPDMEDEEDEAPAKKKKKAKSAMKKSAAEHAEATKIDVGKQIESHNKKVVQLLTNSRVVDADDWEEGADDYSFDDITAMVNKAVQDEYQVPSYNGYGSVTTNYFMYKCWPDKVVVKRSYSNQDKDADLFLAHPYTIEDDKVVLGEPETVVMGFVSANAVDDDFLVAVREADKMSFDDPEASKKPKDESGDDEVDDDEVDDDEVDDDESDDEEEVKESKLKESTVVEFHEAFDSVIDKSTIIKEAKNGSFIIEGMALLGAKSKNNRNYPDDTRKKAIGLFEGIKAYCNHPKKGDEDEPRAVQELIGRHRNVRFDEGASMVRSDLHLSPTRLVKDYIIPHIRSNPSIIGNSISAAGKIADDGTVMEITKARSVDLVAEPATTSGIYESTQKNVDKNTKGEKTMKVDLKEVMEDEEAMAALREHFEEEFEVESSVANLKGENSELKEQLAAYKMKEQVVAVKEEIDGILTEAKLPEDTKKDPELRAILESAKDKDARKAIVSRMEKVAESVSKGKAAPSVEREKITEGQYSNLTEGNLMAQVASMFRARP
jgi:uncharacterized protein YggU (UPF0235/DUF167 family)